MEDFPYLETFMEFAACFLAVSYYLLFPGTPSAATHSRVNLPFVNTEVRPDGFLLPAGVTGRFLDVSVHVGRLRHSQDKGRSVPLCVPVRQERGSSLEQRLKHVVFCGGTEGTGKPSLFSRTC